jgi:hypothetical protein
LGDISYQSGEEVISSVGSRLLKLFMWMFSRGEPAEYSAGLVHHNINFAN